MTQKTDLWALAATLRKRRFVDLTHGFSPETPCAPGLPSATFTTFADFSRGDAYQTHEYRVAGQFGTHVDPPCHFHAGAMTLDQIPVQEMVAPLVVLDIEQEVARDPDHQVTRATLARWEAAHGPVPEGAFVALRSGWSKRWPDQQAMLNRDSAGRRRSPGWGMEVLRVLFEERRITACGHETIDTDRGLDLDKGPGALESYILGLGRWQIEMMANLDQLPVHGAIVVASWAKPLGGSGFPARIFAIA